MFSKNESRIQMTNLRKRGFDPPTDPGAVNPLHEMASIAERARIAIVGDAARLGLFGSADGQSQCCLPTAAGHANSLPD